MFYGLNRFSVGLDFDLLSDKDNDVFDPMIKISKKYGSIKETRRKRFSFFILLSYEEGARNIKIEINRRSFGSRYELKTYLGISMLVMVREDMFAHKLIAMQERIGKTSRDIYDVRFFLEHRWPINKEIVEQRASMPYPKALRECVAQLKKMSNRNILDGLGDLLTEPQKDSARANLRTDTIFLLNARIESDK